MEEFLNCETFDDKAEEQISFLAYKMRELDNMFELLSRSIESMDNIFESLKYDYDRLTCKLL